MVPLSMTLNDLWPRFQGHGVFVLNYYHVQQSWYLKNGKNRGTTVLAINLSINPTISGYQHVRSFSPHHDTVIIHRLRIGHTRLTHSYLLSGTDQPECSACHCPLTVKHILIECPALTSSRNKHFTASSMKDLFTTLLPETLSVYQIIPFL